MGVRARVSDLASFGGTSGASSILGLLSLVHVSAIRAAFARRHDCVCVGKC